MPLTSTASPTRTAVFTIVSRNYLPFARVLMGSLERVCPDWDRIVLLTDKSDAPDAELEPFRLVEAATLPLPEAQKFFFRYTIVELNTAVKPWFFRALFDEGYDQVVYLDPDIFVYTPLADVQALFDRDALAVLVPHLTGRIKDSAHPGEHEILQSGAYNLGFCALRRHPDLDSLLEFWCEKSVRGFVVDLQRGLFTDQRWMDLVPGMFRDVHVLRHEGYDVAYWNLPHRVLTMRDGQVRVNGDPLAFFHFSGIDPANPEALSKHQNRYRLGDVGQTAAALIRTYCAAVVEAGFGDCRNLPYAYGFLRDGSPVSDVLRRLYRTMPDVEAWAGDDPFARTVEDWNEPLDDRSPPLSRAMLAVYHARADVRLTWPDASGADREAFTRWFAETPELPSLIADCYIEPARRAIAAAPAARPARRGPRRSSGVSLKPGVVAGALRKARAAAAEGRLPFSPRRWLELFRLHVSELTQAELAATAPPLPPADWTRRSSTRAGSAESAGFQPAGPALTVVGYFGHATGVAAGAHACLEACAAAGIVTERIDAPPTSPQHGRHVVNLLHVNADQTPLVARALGEEFFEGRYTIGLWAWELEEFPEAFTDAFAWVDEVWTPSRFVQQAVSEKSPVPVVCMPHPVTVAPTAGLTRSHFGLPADRFLFLVMYDALSVQERKNPLGAVEAFRLAFPDDARVSLVVRVNHSASRPDDVALVRGALEAIPGAVLIDGPMSRGDAQALQACCDAFVSLHRSEGFGLNIAEAMLLGKPVVVTGWSGNLDFTRPTNAGLVEYTMETLTRDWGPYRAGQRWAAPNVQHAADMMVRLVGDASHRQQLAERGRQTIADEFSPSAVGARYCRRLELIQRSGKR